MDTYVTGAAIKTLREKQHLTQAELADRLCVSDKAVSKWETGRGLPDITLIEPLAAALRVSLPELLSGNAVTNRNRASNMMRSSIYVCPVCGNVIRTKGEAVIACCGVTLPPLEAEEPDEAHRPQIEKIEDELYVTLPQHEMTKEHAITFLAYVTGDRFETKALYPEGNAEARFFARGHGLLYMYCNRHGLYKARI